MKEYKLRGKSYKIRYNDFAGQGEPIIFIHGLGCAGSFDYSEVAFQLGSEHRIILLDLLGSGYSDKPLDFSYTVESHTKYLKEFIEDLKLEEFIVFGHSLGGPIAIELCTLFEKGVKSLILSEPNLEPSGHGDASFDIANLDADDLDSALDKLIVKYEKEGNTMWCATLKNWLPKAAYDISKDAVKGGRVPWRNLLEQLDIPKSVIFGEKSLPNKDFETLKESDVDLEIIINAGHSMAWENPSGLAQAIKRCLNT